MKNNLIKEGGVYMAVIEGNEIRVQVEMIALGHVIGTNLEAMRGIIVPFGQITAGPLQNDSRLPKQN